MITANNISIYRIKEVFTIYLNIIAGSVPGSPTVGQNHPATGEGVGGEEKQGLVNEIMYIEIKSNEFGTDRTDGDESVDELGDAEHQLGLESVGVEAVALLVHAHLHHHR